MGLNQPPLPPANSSLVNGDDLMRGNYLYRKTNKANELVIVTAIRQTSCNVQQLSNKSETYIAYHQNILLPIPLNNDWMLDLGFAKVNLFTNRNHYKLGNLIIEVAEGGCMAYFNNEGLCTLTYVHQLQNMFYGNWHNKLQIVDNMPV